MSQFWAAVKNVLGSKNPNDIIDSVESMNEFIDSVLTALPSVFTIYHSESAVVRYVEGSHGSLYVSMPRGVCPEDEIFDISVFDIEDSVERALAALAAGYDEE